MKRLLLLLLHELLKHCHHGRGIHWCRTASGRGRSGRRDRTHHTPDRFRFDCWGRCEIVCLRMSNGTTVLSRRVLLLLALCASRREHLLHSEAEPSEFDLVLMVLIRLRVRTESAFSEQPLHVIQDLDR